MFEVGFTEILLILGIALLVLGPEKLPGLAEKVGRWTGRARAMARQLRTQLEHEVTMEEMTRTRAAQPPPPPPSEPEAAPAHAGAEMAGAEMAGAERAASDTVDSEMASAKAAGPELDLDAMVSGVEPAVAVESAEEAAADAAVAADMPLTKSAP